MMRLRILENGYNPIQKLLLGVFKMFTGGMAPGPVLALSYHRDLCGKYLAQCYQEGMRESTEWSVGEVEMFAAFVSKLNGCRY
jgi:hypothetical protein